MKLLEVVHSTNKGKKYTAIFDIDGKKKKVSFGAAGMKDYTIYSKEDPMLAQHRRSLYLMRHRTTESWNNPLSPGALSRWLLWEKPTLQEAMKHFINKFRLY
jgi:hypothetical protein